MKAELFWRIVKHEVKRQNTSFEWLYRKTSIAKGTFSSWKNRNIIPRADAVYKIAAALKVSSEYLLTGLDRFRKQSNPLMNEIVETMVFFDNNDLKAVAALVQSLALRYAAGVKRRG
ncbi:MAG: helix-turn-helix domain containing protein [Candidatus Margulisbacteria bacterium]|jgi:transcriptional regulator with XRE-family HTH domain|nr:helix-turn-helix domain containing protein [Candidatus Margulisiibacteriota bacterium]